MKLPNKSHDENKDENKYELSPILNAPIIEIRTHKCFFQLTVSPIIIFLVFEFISKIIS